MSEPHSGVDPFQLNSLATRKNNGTEHTIKKKRWATVLVSRGALQKECTGLDEKLSKQCKDTESVADKHDTRKREKNKS